MKVLWDRFFDRLARSELRRTLKKGLCFGLVTAYADGVTFRVLSSVSQIWYLSLHEMDVLFLFLCTMRKFSIN